MLASSLVACKQEKKGNVIAQVYEAKLYDSDLQHLFDSTVSSEDSVFLVKEFINSWISRQVVLHESKTVLTDKERDKSKQLDDYLNDLLSYETLNKLAIAKTDSSFSEEELQDYYNQNLDEFELSANILKLVFFQLPADLENLNVLWNDFVKSDADYNTFKALAKEHQSNYSVDSASWVFFDDILKEIPINTYNQEHFLNNNKNIQINEGPYSYFVKILDFRIKSDRSPFELERERIKKILFVKNQKESLKKVETELIEKAYNNNKVIIN